MLTSTLSKITHNVLTIVYNRGLKHALCAACDAFREFSNDVCVI